MVSRSSSKLGDRSLKNDVYAEIVGMLHHGELKPGDRIGETVIAERLGISRSPVREAFSQLESDGVLVRKPRTGSFVAKMSEKDVADVLDARVVLESHAARLAAARITPADIDELLDLIAEMEVAARTRDWVETTMLNGRFHQTILRIADNSILERLWRTLDPLAWLLAPAAVPERPHVPDAIVTRHKALVEALRSGDGDIAASAFRDHIVNAGRSAVEAAKSNGVGPDRPR